MVASEIQAYRGTAYRIVAAQLAVTGVAVVVASWLAGERAAFSAAVGGAISVVAGAYLAAKMFSFEADTPPARVVRAFYVGEVVKIALTAAMFAAAIVALDVDVLVVLLTYLATLTVYWFALAATARRQT